MKKSRTRRKGSIHSKRFSKSTLQALDKKPVRVLTGMKDVYNLCDIEHCPWIAKSPTGQYVCTLFGAFVGTQTANQEDYTFRHEYCLEEFGP